MFEELLNERFDGRKELTNKTHQNNLIYYFKGNTARNSLDDFNNSIEIFVKNKISWNKARRSKNSAEFV